MDGQTQQYTLGIDGRQYTIQGPAGAGPNELSLAARNIQQSASHQQWLAQQKAAIASHNADILQQRAQLGPQNLQPVQTDASGAIVNGLQGKSFDQLQAERFAKEFNTTPQEGQRIAFDVKTKGYEAASQDANRRAANARDAQTIDALHGGQGIGNAVKTLAGLPFEEFDRRASELATGQDYDTIKGQDFVAKFNPALEAAREAAQGPHGNPVSRAATGLVTGLATPSGAAALLAGPVAGGVAKLAPEGSAVAEAAQGAQQIIHGANTGLMATQVGASLPDLVHNPAKFAEENAANIALAASGVRLKPGEGGIPSLSAVADVVKRAATEHPVSGGGPVMDVIRALGGQLPETERLAPATATAAREVAGARVLSHMAMEQTNAGVEAALGKDGVQKFYDAMDENRRRGIEQRYTQMADLADKLKDGTIEPGSVAASMIHSTLQHIDGQGNLPDGILKKFETMAAGTGPKNNAANAFAYAATALRAAAQDTAGRSSWSESPAAYDAFVQTPEFGEALDAWNRGAGRVFQESHAANGGQFSDYPGEFGYFPGIAKDEKGAPAHYGVPMTINDKNRGNYFASGFADSYEPTPENIEQKLTSTVKSNAQANLIRNAVQEGLADKLGRFDARPVPGPDGYVEFTNPGTGEVVKANIVKNGLAFQDSRGNMIPAESYVMPEWFRREIQPLIERSDAPQNALKAYAKALSGLAVAANPADLTSHGMNLVGGLESLSPTNLSDNPLLRVVEHLPLPEVPVPGLGATVSARKLIAMNEMRKVDLTAPDTQAKILAMAKAGVLPERLLVEPDAGSKSVLGTIKQYSTNALDAMDLRARVVMWDNIARFEKQTGVPMTDQGRYDTMRTLGIYNKSLASGLERWQKETGLNPFATAHFQQMRNGFRSWASLMGLDKRYEHLPTAQRLSAKASAQLRGGPLMKMLSWYLTYRIASQFMKPQPNDEKFMRAGGSRVASSLGRGPLGGAIAGGYNAHEAGQSVPEGAALGVENNILQTGMGSLGAAAFAGLSGKAPYLVQGRGDQGPDFVSSVPKGVPNTWYNRLRYGLTNMNQSAKFVDTHVRQFFGSGEP